MESILPLVAHIIYILTVIGYGLYVCANAYTITVAGLQRLYKVFIFHLVLQISMALVGMVRPEDGIFIFSWTNKLLCHLLGRFYCFYCSFQPLLITVFSYYKTEVYTELATSSNVFLRRLRWIMKVALFVAFCDAMFIVGMCNSGPAENLGVRTCAILDTPVIILFGLGGFLFLAINGACILIFWKFRNLAEERREIENLEYQIRLNMYMFPLMHSSTTVIYTSQLYMQFIHPDNEHMITVWYHLIVLDQLLNSYLMYLCLFGKGFGGFIPDLEWSLDDSPSVCNHTVTAYGKTLDAEIWISFAGAHPMLVSEEVVNEMDLWDHVITNERRLKQIKKYRKRGHIASLFQCCITPQDFVFELNNKRIPNSYASDSENRSHNGEERDADLSQAAASAVE